MDEIQKNSLEIVTDILETGLDTLSENEFVKNFPIIGNIIKVGLTVKSINDRIFLAKLSTFLFNLEKINKEEKKSMIYTLEFDEKKKNKIGETLILIIDKLNSFEKPLLVSFCFASYLKNKISFEDFNRLCNSIEIGNIYDLKEFSKESVSQNILDKLFNTGLTEISKSAFGQTQSGGTLVELSINKSELGEKYLRIIKK
ncbi:hypothetical protein C3L50_10370 [Flavobacterium alvei]|uniref:DUF4393 domain-containing protein n=1 Tax=Flavobacterium alvei TaxID=2080416 RepID=A0A2S5ABT8_9FLAO|nr:hypothetical protein [Flavobacterium alvei]POY39563.1 hypothetical protein C3L50_10370 [Flavobacterium alvei]